VQRRNKCRTQEDKINSCFVSSLAVMQSEKKRLEGTRKVLELSSEQKPQSGLSRIWGEWKEGPRQRVKGGQEGQT